MTISENGGLDQEKLDALRKEIEHKLDWGTSENWRHQDFLALSDKILDKTNQQLSHTTLKRIWGKLAYGSLPNTHTLNILSQFAGYENWLSFKNDRIAEDTDEPKAEFVDSDPSKQNDLPKSHTLKWLGFMGLLLLMVIGTIGLMSTDHKKTLDPATADKIKFSSRPVTTGVPNTVIFNYDVSHVDSDSIQIQQSWDEKRRFMIDKNKHEVASTYYYPGHWRAKLIIDDQIIREQNLYIKSDGWVATIRREPIPRYLMKDELFMDGHLGVSEGVQQELESHSDAPESLSYHYIDEFEHLHGDDFSLEASFKNTYTKGDGVCQFSRILIDGTTGIFRIPFSIPGCTGDLDMRFGDIILKGSEHDLSAFGCDFNQWQHLRLDVKNRTAHVYLNNKKIKEIKYQKSIGAIAGLNIRFTGSGIIDHILFKNKEGVAVFRDDFE